MQCRTSAAALLLLACLAAAVGSGCAFKEEEFKVGALHIASCIQN